jgi:hypothetical protein
MTLNLKTFAALGLSLSLFAAAGCHKNLASSTSPDMTPPPTGNPPTATFTADPLAIDLGQSVAHLGRYQRQH